MCHFQSSNFPSLSSLFQPRRSSPGPSQPQSSAPIAASGASEGQHNLWEVAAWEIAHLGKYLTPIFSTFILQITYIQRYPQRMRLQKRLYGIFTVCFLIYMIPCNCKLVSFFAKSLNKPLKDRRLNLTLGSLCFKSSRTSLQSHPL